MLSDLTVEGIIIHHGGKALDMNASMVRLLGVSREEVLGTHFSSWIHPDDLPLVEAQLARDVTSAYVVRMRRGADSWFWAEVEGRNFRQGEREMRVTAIRDISERREAEAQVRKQENLLQQIFLDIHIRRNKTKRCRHIRPYHPSTLNTPRDNNFFPAYNYFPHRLFILCIRCHYRLRKSNTAGLVCFQFVESLFYPCTDLFHRHLLTDYSR